MKWLVIQRRKAQQKKGSHMVELPGIIAPLPVEADDVHAATKAAHRAYPATRLDVVSQLSWNQMTRAERDRHLGNFERPDETKDMKIARQKAAALAAQETGAQLALSPDHCARKGRRHIHGATLAVLRGPTRRRRGHL